MSFHSSINGFDGFTTNLYASLIYHIFKRVEFFYILLAKHFQKLINVIFLEKTSFIANIPALTSERIFILVFLCILNKTSIKLISSQYTRNPKVLVSKCVVRALRAGYLPVVPRFWFSFFQPVVSASSLVWVCRDVIWSWRRLGRTCEVHTPCIGDCGWWCACMCGLGKVWVWSISSLCKEHSYWSVRNYLPCTTRFHFEELSRIHLEHLLEIFRNCIKEFN